MQQPPHWPVSSVQGPQFVQHPQGATTVGLHNIACVACGNQNVQKVSAICASGNWGANTSGSYSGSAVGVGMGLGNAYGSGVLSSSVTSGTINTSTFGGTHLSLALTPPPSPRLPLYQTPYVATAAWVFGSLAAFLLLLLLSLSSDPQRPSASALLVLGALTMLAGAFTAYLTYLAIPQVQHARAHHAQQVAAARQRWEIAMHRWNNLFYCSRCDNVYHPQTSSYAPPQQMHRLL